MTSVTKVLSVLVFLQDIVKMEECPKARVQKQAEVSNSTFPSLISRMAKKGLVEYGSNKGTLKITAMGREEAPDGHDFPTSDEEYHQTILKKLKNAKARQIFEILMDGRPHSKQDIMEAIDCTNPKTFAPLLSRELKKPGYIIYPGRDTVQLSDECYPCSRAA